MNRHFFYYYTTLYKYYRLLYKHDFSKISLKMRQQSKYAKTKLKIDQISYKYDVILFSYTILFSVLGTYGSYKAYGPSDNARSP